MTSTFLRRVGASTAAFVAASAAILSVSTPAQAWDYCDHYDSAMTVTVYLHAGYCAPAKEYDLPADGDWVEINGGWDNEVSSVVNMYNGKVEIRSGHDGTGRRYVIGSRNSHPHLGNTAVGNDAASSMRRCTSARPC